MINFSSFLLTIFPLLFGFVHKYYEDFNQKKLYYYQMFLFDGNIEYFKNRFKALHLRNKNTKNLHSKLR